MITGSTKSTNNNQNMQRKATKTKKNTKFTELRIFPGALDARPASTTTTHHPRLGTSKPQKSTSKHKTTIQLIKHPGSQPKRRSYSHYATSDNRFVSKYTYTHSALPARRQTPAARVYTSQPKGYSVYTDVCVWRYNP